MHVLVSFLQVYNGGLFFLLLSRHRANGVVCILMASGEPTKKKRRKSGAGLGAELTPLRKLMAAEKRKPKNTESLESLGFHDVLEVTEMSEEKVVARLEEHFTRVALSILEGKSAQYTFPSRDRKNQKYIHELNRLVLDVKNIKTRHFAHVSETRKTAIMTRVMDIVYHVLKKGIHVTKRDLFYSDVNLFQKQEHSDPMLDDVATMLGCTRSSLHVIASEKGVVIGNLRFVEAGDEIDCTKMGVGAKGIPPHLDKVTNIRSEAEFILVVEKDAAFMRLAEDRFYNEHKCIIITAKGQPDVASRMFLRRLKEELRIPVLALVDSDPSGLKILSVYMSGSMNMSYDSASLTTPDIKWLGVLPSDLDKYNIPQECRIPMTDRDIDTCKQLLNEDFVTQNPKWVKELKLMMKTKEKAEIQALSSFGFQYLTKDYLPRKLREGDWA